MITKYRLAPLPAYKYPCILYAIPFNPRVPGWDNYTAWTQKQSLMSMYVYRYHLSGDTALHNCVHHNRNIGLYCILEYTSVIARRNVWDYAYAYNDTYLMRVLVNQCKLTQKELSDYSTFTHPRNAVARSIINNELCKLRERERVVRY